MKNYVMGIVMTFALLLCSCQKEEHLNNFVTANFNGRNWQGKTFTKVLGDNRMGVSFEVKENGIRSESLGFDFIPKELGKLLVDFITTDTLFHSGYGTLSHDGDVIKDFYYLEKSNQSNYVSITELTETEIKGEFDLTFTIDTTRIKHDLNAPDTIHFSNGKFNAIIYE